MVGRQGREISDAVKGETGGSEAERKKIKRRSVGRSVGLDSRSGYICVVVVDEVFMLKKNSEVFQADKRHNRL